MTSTNHERDDEGAESKPIAMIKLPSRYRLAVDEMGIPGSRNNTKINGRLRRIPKRKSRYRNGVDNGFSWQVTTRAGDRHRLECDDVLEQSYQQESDHCSKRSAGKIDPVIVQPLPAADMNRFGAAGMERVFLGLFLISRAEIHRLYGRTQK